MFNKSNFCHIASNNRNEQKGSVFIYKTADTLAQVTQNGYFNEKLIDINLHDLIIHVQYNPVDRTLKKSVLIVTERTLENVETAPILDQTIGDDIDQLGDQVAGIEAKIPESASETNPLITKQQLLDEEMDIREDMDNADGELQTQITAQAGAIALLDSEKLDKNQGAENAGKILEVDNEGKVKPASKPSSLPLLFHTWSDCIMNNQSWLRADAFSWHSGDTYKAAYESIKNGYDSLSSEVLYAYDDEYDNVLYLKTSTPSIGDQLFDENGEPANKDYGGWFVRKIYSDGSISYDPNTPDTRYYRNASKDIVLSVPASTTETIGDITITYYRAKNGRKICLPDQESNLLTLYNSTGVAWYYILDTENKRFKLPRTKYGFTGLRDIVGNYVPESLPTHTHTRGSMNITGGFNSQAGLLNIGSVSGAFSRGNVGTGYYGGSSQNNFAGSVDFDASRSWTGSTSEPDNSVYGSKKPVQQRATQMCLYFYAGNFEQTATEQTAGLNTELFNGKADRDLNNLPSNYDYVVATQEPTSANGYTWFRKYKSGWVEQGGRAVIYDGEAGPNQYNAKDISIPVPMKHCTNWHCQAKHDRFNTGIGQDNITTTVHIYQANDSTSSFTNAFVIWEINGYAA